MKIFKRNQLIVLVISLMLIVAGYLNFTANYDNTIETSGYMAELGDATLVNTEPISNSVSTEIVTDIESEENIENTIEEKSINEDLKDIETATQPVEDAYFTTSKLERESMYSQMLATYQEIYNNSGATAEQKAEAISEISNINSIKNAIMIAENLISAKGFEKVVVFSNTNSVSVVIGKEELKPEEIAQIQNIVSRELGVTADLIHISTK